MGELAAPMETLHSLGAKQEHASSLLQSGWATKASGSAGTYHTFWEVPAFLGPVAHDCESVIREGKEMHKYVLQH